MLKKFLIITGVSLITAIVMSGCSPKSSTKNEEKADTINVNDSLARIEKMLKEIEVSREDSDSSRHLSH